MIEWRQLSEREARRLGLGARMRPTGSRPRAWPAGGRFLARSRVPSRPRESAEETLYVDGTARLLSRSTSRTSRTPTT